MSDKSFAAQTSPHPAMTVEELVAEYRIIAKFFNERWPLPDKNQRVFARTMKIIEELGELSDELLTSMNLSRDTKIAKFSQENIEDEFADVLACVVSLGIELDLDVEEVMRRKIKFTHERYEMDR
jgi:NTP pyrophosphatase (non-canonical NTP hydrolase)